MKNNTRSLLTQSLIPTLLLLLLQLGSDSTGTASRPLDAILISAPGIYLLTLLMGIISRNLPWRLGLRAAVLFVLSFAVMILGTGIELQIFSIMDPGDIAIYYIHGSWQLGVYAFAVAYLFRPQQEDSFEVAFRRHWQQRAWHSWAWRIPLAMAAYIFLYLIVGAVAYQFTGPYYADPSHGLSLTVPPIDIIVQVQIVRSMIYLLAIVGLIAGLPVSRWKTAWLAGLALFMLGGFVPLLSNYEWPAALRAYHAVEILFQNLPAGMAMAYLLNPSKVSVPMPVTG